MDKDSCGCGKSPGEKLAAAGRPPCPVCGKPGEVVQGDTVRKMLKPGLTAPWDRYLVCRTAACETVYFHPKGDMFRQADVAVPVYFKAGADPVYACYCSGITKAQVLAAVQKTGATRWASIVKEITGAVPKCRCAEKNPPAFFIFPISFPIRPLKRPCPKPWHINCSVAGVGGKPS